MTSKAEIIERGTELAKEYENGEHQEVEYSLGILSLLAKGMDETHPMRGGPSHQEILLSISGEDEERAIAEGYNGDARYVLSTHNYTTERLKAIFGSSLPILPTRYDSYNFKTAVPKHSQVECVSDFLYKARRQPDKLHKLRGINDLPEEGIIYHDVLGAQALLDVLDRRIQLAYTHWAQGITTIREGGEEAYWRSMLLGNTVNDEAVRKVSESGVAGVRRIQGSLMRVIGLLHEESEQLYGDQKPLDDWWVLGGIQGKVLKKTIAPTITPFAQTLLSDTLDLSAARFLAYQFKTCDPRSLEPRVLRKLPVNDELHDFFSEHRRRKGFAPGSFSEDDLSTFKSIHAASNLGQVAILPTISRICT